MKKYLLLATATLIALPLFNSCNKPTGDPEKDAKHKKSIIEQNKELEIEYLEKKLKVAEYYAEKSDYKTYRRFLHTLERLNEKVRRQYNNEHIDEYRNITNHQRKANKALHKDDAHEVSAPYNYDYDYDNYDY